ncbi:hypothetical protein rosmuc_02447 [Roseovarius mucosus DSM 17069]|uniref:Cytochrome c domain-containing protein n=2 Tax=Roseovarius mucosus TaxID=215743 RepID=A0A0A0HKI3_9RHOB|nr:hypothetical protein rosmuc_02447 [Roseovarius mucosus DSM 17069]
MRLLMTLCDRLSRTAMLWLAVVLLLLPGMGRADDKRFRLSAPEALVQSGLLQYIVPRFALKVGVRVEVVDEGTEAEITLGQHEGRAVFEGAGAVWRMGVSGTHPGAARFADWLTSEIGQRTVTSYEVAGVAPFRLPQVVEEAEATVVFEGDPAVGKRVSLLQCGRCHVVAPENRMGAIGSTPSFAVLRTFADWDARFQSFFALKPHPAFTQVAGVTQPFAHHLPSPISPIEVTLDELEAIIAYVAGLAPADLGAPIQVQ